ncbi:MAG: DUF5620 domain-containing protein [Oscillospiraceae bacterium]|nr:DUF5620 domain-containing protein [Oscillospiraceae bacterium]
MKHYTWRKRTAAAVMSVAMLSTTLVATPIVWAATSEVSVNKELAISSQETETYKDGGGNTQERPVNWKDCRYTSYLKETAYKNYSETNKITSLQFNFTASEQVAKFSYWFGINVTEKYGDWYSPAEEAIEGYIDYGDSTSNDFTITIDLSKVDVNYYDSEHEWAVGQWWNEEKRFDMQNCYADTIEGVAIPVTLKSVTINGTAKDMMTDTPPAGYKGGGGEEVEAKYPNTGDAGFYNSQNTQSGNYSFVDNKDGTATISATLTKKINAEDLKAFAKENYGTDTITLTPSPKGKDYSEEYYKTQKDENGNVMEEADVRKAGLPLNSHRFSYADFGITADSDAARIIPEALTLVMRAPEGQNVTRVMYGAGLNVFGKSPADTEAPKTAIGRDADGNVVDSSLAGFKEDPNAGYWYNDIGADNYDEIMTNVQNAGAEFGVTVQNGKDLKEQNFGDYVEVTWDVPEEVKPYADVKQSTSLSFQLWYGEIEAEEYTALESLDIDSAMLTYTQEITFPYQASQTLTTNTALTTGADPAEFLFADFDQMTYTNTADVYAILFTLDTKVSARQLVLGSGTTVLDKKSDDHWYQADTNGTSITLLSADDAKKEYTYMWVMPQAVATTYKYAEDGSVNKSSPILNYISTEQPNDNFKLGLYYADDASAKEVTSATVKDVTVYYTTDDKNNTAKSDMFEKDLTANPKNMVLEVGDTKKITTNVDNCTFTSSDDSIASVDEYGNVTGNAGGTVTITVTTPKGQTATVEVTVNAVTTTTTTAPLVPLYGDTNLDGIVDLRDAIVLNRFLANQITFSDQQSLNADVYAPSASKTVNELDSQTLIQYVVLLISTLPVTE